MTLSPTRGPGLLAVLVLSWGAGRLVLSRILGSGWGLDREMLAQTAAVAVAQWLLLGGGRVLRRERP